MESQNRRFQRKESLNVDFLGGSWIGKEALWERIRSTNRGSVRAMGSHMVVKNSQIKGKLFEIPRMSILFKSCNGIFGAANARLLIQTVDSTSLG